MTWNDITANLPAYPMEELARIRSGLVREGKKVFDFGTGDPRIPTDETIRNSLAHAIPEISQYPSIKGTAELQEAIDKYLKRHYQFDWNNLGILPSNGSKEAVFHLALCSVGRLGRRTIAYPNPGYPVYRSSTLFAGGKPYAISLSEQSNYKIKPWDLPKEVVSDLAALWINYPHNPTGAIVDEEYLHAVHSWCKENKVLMLSDDCYADIYDSSWDANGKRPAHCLSVGVESIISVMSLSKRSGMTGYRSGFIVGDNELMPSLAKARANFGVGTPSFVQAAAVTAWNDEKHVSLRRKEFSERLELATEKLSKLGFVEKKPEAGFYLWCKLPSGKSDLDFCLGLAKHGVITSPSSWLSEGIEGYFRLAMVPNLDDTKLAMNIIEDYCRSEQI